MQTSNSAKAGEQLQCSGAQRETSTVSYTVASDLGGTVMNSLVANFSSGADTFTLPDSGITSVTIARTTPSSVWDFFIDDVAFTAFPITTAECKDGGWETFGVFKNQGQASVMSRQVGRISPLDSSDETYEDPFSHEGPATGPRRPIVWNSAASRPA